MAMSRRSKSTGEGQSQDSLCRSSDCEDKAHPLLRLIASVKLGLFRFLVVMRYKLQGQCSQSRMSRIDNLMTSRVCGFDRGFNAPFGRYCQNRMPFR